MGPINTESHISLFTMIIKKLKEKVCLLVVPVAFTVMIHYVPLVKG